MWITLLLIYFVVGIAITGALIAAAVMSGLTSDERLAEAVNQQDAPRPVGLEARAELPSAMRWAQKLNAEAQVEESTLDYLRDAQATYDELRLCRELYPEASFDEIALLVAPRGRALINGFLKRLAAPPAEVLFTESRRAGRDERSDPRTAAQSVSRALVHQSVDADF